MRNLLTVLAVMVCLGSVCALLVQRQNLNSLRAVQPQRTAQVDPASETARNTIEQAPAADASSELLQLRSEVTRLKARQRELAGVPAEAERLRAQLASSGTNAAVPLPPGFIRKAEARMAGYSTPENTVESFLCALQNHDFTNLLKVLAPASAQDLQEQMQRDGQKPEEFFKHADALPGLAIRSQQALPDGSVELQVEFGPGTPPQRIVVLPVNGEWKLRAPF